MSSTPVPTVQRVLVVEDHPVVRQGLVHMVNATAGFTVCADTGDRTQVRELARRYCPTVVLFDLLLDNRHGLDVVGELIADDAALRVLVISMLNESVYAERALRAGAVGYVMKSAETREIQLALRNVAEGRIYLSPQIFVAVFRGLLKQRNGDTAGPLSDRELQVYQMIGAGLPNREIASSLGISVKTVEAHRENIKTKLGLDDARELSASAQDYVASFRSSPAGGKLAGG